MLNFTARGAVRTPTTLQIRVGGSTQPGALRAGAPVPVRSLNTDELLANFAHFTTGRRTTRTRPCTRLTLSGVGDVAVNVAAARSLGFEHVVLHGDARPDVVEAVDRVVVRYRSAGAPAWPAHSEVHVVVPVDPALALEDEAWVAALVARRPASVAFRWSYPDASHRQVVPPAEIEHLAPLRAHLEQADIPTSIGGLPPCLTGAVGGNHRTSNRFYVDASHQLDEALLFFPDIVELSKPDTCRTCSITAWCDGIARAWLENGGLGVLQPIAGEPRER